MTIGGKWGERFTAPPFRRSGRASSEREPPLHPARWPRLPSGRTLLRATVVAVLLLLAAGALYAGEPGGSCPGPRDMTAAPTTAHGQTGVDGRPGHDATSGAAPADGSPAEPNEPASARPSLPPGLVGVPVRIAEPAALAFVRPGAQVDLLASSDNEARLLASRALVLDVVGTAVTDGNPALYLALKPEQAHATVTMPAETRFTIIVRDLPPG